LSLALSASLQATCRHWEEIMEWEGREESENVEDRRSFGRNAGIAVGGIGGLVLVVLGLIFGIDPGQLGGGGGGPGGGLGPGPGPDDGQPRQVDPQEDKLAHFTKVIFGDTERVWTRLFHQMGKEYRKPTLVLFSGSVDSACGQAGASVGPFYCPGDGKVYIDLSFYRDMEKQLQAPGEFARAYVVAHEVGHHVQKLLGYSARVEEAHRDLSGGRLSKEEYNQMSVRLELQADYFAGVWAHHGQEQYHFLQPGDIESAIHAAYEIGDDLLQRKAQGRVVPEKFTHGTSKQRMRWFKAGFDTGDIDGARKLFALPYGQL
jgi:predicted metalloprotease